MIQTTSSITQSLCINRILKFELSLWKHWSELLSLINLPCLLYENVNFISHLKSYYVSLVYMSNVRLWINFILVILCLLFILFTFYVSHIYTSSLIFLYSCEKRKWIMLQILCVEEQNFPSSDCTKKVLFLRAKNFHHMMKISWFFKTVLDLLISN